MLLAKTEYIRDEKHRRFIASLPCVICCRTDVQAAHIRHGNDAGMGLKSGDDCVVPLCVDCHRRQGEQTEFAFWSAFGGVKKATKLAHNLYKVSGDRDAALILTGAFLHV